MKKQKNRVFEGLSGRISLLVICGLFAVACSEEDAKKENKPGQSEVTLDGGPYSNMTARTTDPALAVYSPDEDATAITFTASADGEDFHVVIAFPGKAKGQHSWNEDDCFVQTAQNIGEANESVTATFITPDGDNIHIGHVKIDNYGDVNGIVSGSFEGNCTFVDASCGNCMEEGTMKGKFEARRVN